MDYAYYANNLTDELLEEYPWLKPDDFVDIERVVAELPDIFSISDLLFKLDIEGRDLHFRIAKELPNLQLDKSLGVYQFIALLLSALKYKILKFSKDNENVGYMATYENQDSIDKWLEDSDLLLETGTKVDVIYP